MSGFKIGVLADSFRLPVRDGLRKAAEVGAEGVQVFAVAGEMAPENMDSGAREDFKGFCAELGLEISALCGDLGGHGFQVAGENPERVERSKRIVDLAVDLGTSVVTTHIGLVPEDISNETYVAMREACRELGEYAKGAGVTFAIETGPEPASCLKDFLDDVARSVGTSGRPDDAGSPGIGVNMDPANLVMVVADDPVQAVKTLKGYIVHTHAKDGVRYKRCDPEQVYDAFAEGGVEGLDMGKLFEEVPLGKGGVDWDAYLAALREIGFSGFLTIEREVGDDPETDIREAVRFLKEKLGVGEQ